MKDKIDELANAFLRWQLPESVCADLCATKQGPGRVGTNLLSFTEAKQMMLDVVGPTLAALEQDLREDRHLAKLADENAVLMKHVAELEQALFTANAKAELLASCDPEDKARLDWWQGLNAGEAAYIIDAIHGFPDIRAAIDAARKGQP